MYIPADFPFAKQETHKEKAEAKVDTACCFFFFLSNNWEGNSVQTVQCSMVLGCEPFSLSLSLYIYI